MKVLYYLQYVVTEDVESQRRGLVGVFWWPSNSGITKTSSADASSSESESEELTATDGEPDMLGPRDHIIGARLFSGAPGRVAAVHVCFPDKPIFHWFRSALALGLGKSRQRIKIHSGK